MMKVLMLTVACVCIGIAKPATAAAQCGYCETVYDGEDMFYSHLFWINEPSTTHSCYGGPGGGAEGCHGTYAAQACTYYHNWCQSLAFKTPEDAFDAALRVIADAKATAQLLAAYPKEFRFDSKRGVIQVTGCDGSVHGQVRLTGQQHLTLAVALRSASSNTLQLSFAGVAFANTAHANLEALVSRWALGT